MGAARLLAVERRRALQAEDPVVPGVSGDGGPLLLGAELDLDRQPWRHGVAGQEPQQARAYRGRQLPPDDVVGVGAFGHRLERLGDAIEASPADESERVLGAPAAGLRARDEEVHLGFGAIAHVVDELDFRLQEIRVALLAIEKHPQLRSVRRLRDGGDLRGLCGLRLDESGVTETAGGNRRCQDDRADELEHAGAILAVRHVKN